MGIEDQNAAVEQVSADEDNQRVFIGFHPFGGIRLQAEDVRLTPQDAFALAGQLTAHATMMLQQEYMEQAMAQQMAAEKGIIIPGR